MFITPKMANVFLKIEKSERSWGLPLDLKSISKFLCILVQNCCNFLELEAFIIAKKVIFCFFLLLFKERIKQNLLKWIIPSFIRLKNVFSMQSEKNDETKKVINKWQKNHSLQNFCLSWYLKIQIFFAFFEPQDLNNYFHQI